MQNPIAFPGGPDVEEPLLFIRVFTYAACSYAACSCAACSCAACSCAAPVRTIYLASDLGRRRAHRPPQTPLSLRFPHPSMSHNGTSATTLLRINLRQLREQLTQDGGDLDHLGTGGVFGAPAAGE